MDVRDDTTRSNGDVAEELVQFLVVADSELDVARHNASALVVARRVASELEDFGLQFHLFFLKKKKKTNKNKTIKLFFRKKKSAKDG